MSRLTQLIYKNARFVVKVHTEVGLPVCKVGRIFSSGLEAETPAAFLSFSALNHEY